MELGRVWEDYCKAQWPKDLGAHDAELITLDSVITGCVRYYLNEDSLDPARVSILDGCLVDLDSILPHLHGEGLEYCTRLRTLARLLLEQDLA